MTAAFAVLTCVFTYPQILQLSSHVGGHYDALFSIWRLAWFAHQMWTDPAHLFDANIFHPETGTLAYSDAIPLLGLAAAPFIWIGVKPVVAYNVLVLLSFVASGTAMYALARRLTGSSAAAFVAGSIFTFQQYRVAHFPQIELLWTCWIPLSFLLLHDLIDRPRLKTGVLLGIAVSLQAWCSLYYAVYLVLALLLVAPIFLMARREWRIRDLLGPTAAAGAIAVVLCGPYALPYIANRSGIANRAEQEAETWSPIVGNYLATAQTSVFYNAEPPRVGHIEGVLFPGFAAAILALCGMAARFGAIAIGYGLLLAAAFDLSLGVHGFLHAPVTALVPPFQSLRVPARMFVIVSTCMSVLAAFTVARMHDWKPRTGPAIAAFLAAVVFLEALATPIPLDALPSGPTLIYRWLAAQPPTTIMEWPLPKASNLGHTRAPHQMFFSTLHWQRLINGYSGYYPDSFFEFLAYVDRFPDDQSLWYLQRRRVQYILLHSDTEPAAYRAALDFLRTHRDVEIMMRQRVGEAEATLVRIRGV